MIAYVLPFLTYLISSFLGLHLIKLLLVGGLLVYFWKEFKIKFKLDFLALILGVIVFLFWVLLDPYYPHLGSSYFIPSDLFSLVVRVLGILLIAPLIEELFVRDFMVRVFIAKDWKKVKIGTYTPFSFVVTVLFFGFSHNKWLVGLIAGILWNLLLYKRKRIDSCIQSHFFANLCLVIYILISGSWNFW